MAHARIYSTSAIILKRRNTGEADRVLTVFSKEHGKIQVIAKGTRRITSKRASALEPFSLVQLFLYKAKTWDHVTDVKLLDGFWGIRTDLSRMSIGYYLCELIDGLLPDHQEQRDVFQLLLATLQQLQSSSAWNQDIFTLELLRYLGFAPHGAHLLPAEINTYLETIMERRMRSYRFLSEFS